MRWLTAGESHGPALLGVLEGFPANVEISTAVIEKELARRRLGYGRGARQKFERDELTILGGVRHGFTQGGPIALKIGNTEWPKWETVMSADPVEEEQLASQARNAALTRPRPGHADLAGMQKFGFSDARPVLERASARETAMRVALGAVAKAFLEQVAHIEIISHVISIGTVSLSDDNPLPEPKDREAIDQNEVRCINSEVSERMIQEIDLAHKEGDTLGGVIEVLAYRLPPGLGSYTQWDRRLDAKLAAAMMGIQAIKGVEIGEGFASSRKRGSEAHDEMTLDSKGKVKRISQRSGGTEGGMSTGEVIRVRAAMKPISSVPKALQTIDTAKGEIAKAHHQRSDVCAVPAAAIVAEAMVALTITEEILEKFGGDSLSEIRRNLDSYIEHLVVP